MYTYMYAYVMYVYTCSRIGLFFSLMDNVNSRYCESHTAAHGVDNKDKKEKTHKRKVLVLP